MRKVEINNDDLLKYLGDRDKITKEGFPLFDQIEAIVSEVIKGALPKIATDNDTWTYLKPFIDPEVYKEANGKLAEVYRQLQKLEYKMSRTKEKVLKIVDQERIALGEFEEISSVRLDDGKAIAEILDKAESYKEMLREKRDEK